MHDGPVHINSSYTLSNFIIHRKKNNQNTHKHTKLLSLTLKTFFLLNEQKKNENEMKDLNDN